MKSLLENLIKNFEIAEIIRQPINNAVGTTVGHNATVLDHRQQAVGGGTATTTVHAFRVAIAEIAERYLFQNMSLAEQEIYLVDEYPTTCGFAAGFNKEKTQLRSLCEGLERWIWSKWIDDGFNIPEIDNQTLKSSLSQHLFDQFEIVKYYRKTFNLNISGVFCGDLVFGAVVGIKNGGAFAGSRVCTQSEDSWEHGLIEAWRNLNNFETFKDDTDQYRKGNAAAVRGHYFGSNLSSALNQIARANKVEWPVPKLRFSKEFPNKFNGVHFYRTLFHDYVGWEKGSESRFVY